jgi:hypothetical protein
MKAYGGVDSVFGIATGYGLDDRGVGVPSPGRIRNFLFSTSSKPALGPNPTDTGGFFPWGKAARA